jgi:putative oxidoreductase
MSNTVQWLQHGARVLLGLIFFVFGLNFFFNFLPPFPAPPEAGLQFLGGLQASGYVFPLIKAIEVVCAVLLLSNRFVPLALVLLAPITVNIVGFHVLLAPAYGMPLLIVALTLFLAFTHRAAYASLFRARSEAVSVTRDQAAPSRAATSVA